MFEGLDQLLDFVEVSRFTVSTVRRVTTVQMTGAGAAGSNATAETVDLCEVVQPLGLMAYPTIGDNTEAMIARIGDKPVALALIDKSRAAQAVEEGEVRLYGPGSSNATAIIRIRNSGAIEITAKDGVNIALNVSGAGEVVLDGGSLKVARVTDATTGHTHAPGSLQVVIPGGSSAGTYPVVGATATATDTIASSGGASQVKA